MKGDTVASRQEILKLAKQKISSGKGTRTVKAMERIVTTRPKPPVDNIGRAKSK